MSSVEVITSAPRREARRALVLLRTGLFAPVSAAYKLRDRRMRFDLWGGAEAEALQKLQKTIASPWSTTTARLGAVCTLSTWLDFNDRSDEALSLLAALGVSHPRVLRSHQWTIRMATLLHRKGDLAQARAILDRTKVTNSRVGANVALARANVVQSDEERIAIINERFARSGLAGLRLIDPALPLTLGNIAVDSPSCGISDMGKVTVIMPAFQAERTIRTALHSVLQQTYRNLEVIVVDDCSPDRTSDAVEEIAGSDARVKLIRQPENRGAYPARNRALAEATGTFVTTHDADDWSHPQKIELELAALAEDPDLAGVVTFWARVRPPFIFTSNWRLGHEILHWSHSSFLFRGTICDRLGTWDEVRVSADTEFIWRIQKAYGEDSIQRLRADVPLAFALDDESSLTRRRLTHVRTTYFGLRHYYREICRYWQNRYPEGLPPEAAAEKARMIPVEMYRSDPQPVEIDLLLTGDLSVAAVIRQMRKRMDASPGLRFGLAHRLDTTARRPKLSYAAEFHDEAFPLIADPRVRIVLPSSEPAGVPRYDVNRTQRGAAEARETGNAITSMQVSSKT